LDSILTGRINVPLSASEAHALKYLAEIEHRQPREEARFIIYNELLRRGLLPQPGINQPQPCLETEGRPA
jgi:hypothetical protein